MRFLFYSHDSYGLGHIRRTTVIANRLIRNFPAPSALVVTGSPRAHYFRYPPHCDYLKLPSVTKGPGGQYVSRDIEMSISETVALRGRLIREAAESFRPDVFFADHTPRGLGGEILPALDDFMRLPDAPVRIVGMRDVIDEPEAVKRAWDAERTVDVLRCYYDLILVYGQREVFDPVREYELPDDLAAKIRFVGYIGRNGSTTSPEAIRERFAPRTGLLVAVTAGGGGDGSSLMNSFLEGYERLGSRPPFETLLITGPLMSPRKRKRILARVERLEGARVLEYFEDIPGICHSADFVIAMGGYNTICELAYAGASALIVPRTSPRREQLLRAQRLAERGVVHLLLPEAALPDALIREVLEGLDRPRPPRRWGLDFSGLENICRAVADQRPTTLTLQLSSRVAAEFRS